MTDTAESLDPAALIFSPDIAAAPQETYDTIRRTCPVARSEFMERTTMYLSRHDDVCWAMRHPEYFTSEIADDMALGEQPLIPLQVDPPLHTQYRRLLNPSFVPREIEDRRTLPVDFLNHVEDLLHQLGRQTHRRLVHA